jgi:hypothetical protein
MCDERAFSTARFESVNFGPVTAHFVPLRCEQMDVYLPPWQNRALEHATAWFKEHLQTT